MHDQLIDYLYEVIASTEYTSAVNYPTYPSDYKGDMSSTPFLKVHVLTGQAGRPSYKDTKSLSGLLILSIYYPSGTGQKTPAEISSMLDSVFQDQILGGKLFLKESSLQFMGDDRSVPTVPRESSNQNSTLSRADYTVPFTYYGVI